MTPADPALHDAVAHRELTGLSGCRVYLMTTDGKHWIVRKVAGDPAGNARLKAQADKQDAMVALGLAPVRVPEVLATGEIDGRFHVDMAYVRGTNAITHLRRASYDEVVAASDAISGVLETFASLPVDGLTVDLFDVLYAKVVEVHDRVGGLDDALVGQVLLLLEPLRKLGPVAATRCHGDLTLENMIFDADGTLWLLDLLDSPVEHYWQDVAKLHQDLFGGWYQRREMPISRSVLEFVGDRVWKSACALDDSYPDVHRPLLVSTFLRILPYVTTTDDRELVDGRLRYLLDRSTEIPPTP